MCIKNIYNDLFWLSKDMHHCNLQWLFPFEQSHVLPQGTERKIHTQNIFVTSNDRKKNYSTTNNIYLHVCQKRTKKRFNNLIIIMVLAAYSNHIHVASSKSLYIPQNMDHWWFLCKSTAQEYQNMEHRPVTGWGWISS